MKKSFIKIVSVFAFLGLFVASCKSDKNEFDASGVFEANETIISAESSGKILNLGIEEGSTLQAGQAIGTIDCLNLGLQKAQVQASIDALSDKQNNASPQTSILEEQLKSQQAQVATQKEQIRVLEKERIRLQNLVNAEAIPTKQLDDLTGQMSILQKQILATETQASVLRQQINSQKEQVSIQNRGILSERKPLQERIAQIDDQLKRCTIINPVAGTVMVKYAETNEITNMGKPLYKIAKLDTLTLRAYITGDQLSKIKLNQTVKILVDNGKQDYKELAGNIAWISSKSEFTPKTIQTKDERANLVYATKVKVKNDGFLKIGMYGELKF